MDQNIVVNVYGPHEGVYFSLAVAYRNVSTQAIDSYMAQVFNAMIQFKFVTGKEKMVSLTNMLTTQNAHFTMIERFDHRTREPSKDQILEMVNSVLGHIPFDHSPLTYLVDYDPAKPIQCYERQIALKSHPRLLNVSTKTIFTDFPQCEIGYVLTQKTNPQ